MRLHTAMTGSHTILKNFTSVGKDSAISFEHRRFVVLLSTHLHPGPNASAGEKSCLYSARLCSSVNAPHPNSLLGQLTSPAKPWRLSSTAMLYWVSGKLYFSLYSASANAFVPHLP